MHTIFKILTFRTLGLFIALFMAAQPSGTANATSSGEVHRAYSDISVDRSTAELNLRTFMEAVDRAAIRLEAREWARDFYGAWLYPAITPEQAAETELLKTYILDSMDLSAFPDWRRDSAGIETAMMLRDLLRDDRVT